MRAQKQETLSQDNESNPDAESLKRLQLLRHGAKASTSEPPALPKTAQEELREIEENEKRGDAMQRHRLGEESTSSINPQKRHPDLIPEEEEEQEAPPAMTARERKLFELRKRMMKVSHSVRQLDRSVGSLEIASQRSPTDHAGAKSERNGSHC